METHARSPLAGFTPGVWTHGAVMMLVVLAAVVVMNVLLGLSSWLVTGIWMVIAGWFGFRLRDWRWVGVATLSPFVWFVPLLAFALWTTLRGSFNGGSDTLTVVLISFGLLAAIHMILVAASAAVGVWLANH